MINVKITMIDGSEYNIRNIADNIKDFYKRVLAPYGTQMTFVEIIKGELINTVNIVSIKELTDEDVNAINTINEPKEEVIGLTETEVEVDNIEPKELEVAQ